VIATWAPMVARRPQIIGKVFGRAGVRPDLPSSPRGTLAGSRSIGRGSHNTLCRVIRRQNVATSATSDSPE
jgi:hypothetical protein